MNDDLISRQAVLDIIDKWYPQKTPRMIKMISELPSVNPQEPCGDVISLEAFKQVMWERDIAIGQLKELGYGFGQKIEPSGDLISRQAVLDIIHLFFTEEVDKIPTKKTEDGEVYIIRKCQPLFEMNKAICKRIRALPSASPTQNCVEKCVGNALDALDCISRQAVLDALTKTSGIRGDALKALYDLPSVNPQEPKWISVSESLPEKKGRYLTTILNEYDNRLRYIMTCDYFPNGCWCPDEECASSNVIAWMPLPEPYKAESEEVCDT